MRLTCVLQKVSWAKRVFHCRPQQNPEQIKFKNHRLPLRLRDRVSGKSSRTKEITGLEELGSMLAALKTHEFNEKYCQTEIAEMKKAFQQAKLVRDEERRIANSGVINTGTDLHYLQLNRYLKKFPQPK